MVHRIVSACFLLASLAGCNSAPPIGDAMVGPLIGHVADDAATIWMYDGPEARFRIEIAEADGTNPRSAEFTADATADHAATVTIDGLRPDTAYRYTIVPLHDTAKRPAWAVEGNSSEIAGTFTTAPPPGAPGRFTVAVSSCIKRHPSRQKAWPALLAQEPSFQLLLGDNAYTDSTRTERIWRGHVAVRAMPGFAEVIRNVPTYAIWDDHDYGSDNSNRTTPGKERSLAAFKALFPNPAYGTPDVPGVFHRFRWGEVEFFMLDVRYHRSPPLAIDDDSKRMLGNGQFQWLAAALLESDAKFKVLASGSTLRDSVVDSWRLYDFARKRLFGFIVANRIDGVLFLTGDMHYSTIRTHALAETGGYELTEVISSGIANSRAQSFATLAFDTAAADPTVQISIIEGDGAISKQRTLRRSQLRVPE